MRQSDRARLRRELRAAGADNAELDALLPVAAQLEELRDAPVMPSGRRWLQCIKPAAIALSGAAVGMFVVIFSQSVLPTSWLYPVQKLSDTVAVSIHPAYRAEVMMKRAEQVHVLVSQHADSGKVLATLADYTAQAGAYKATPGVNYAAFEYCESNLKQAAVTATPTEKDAISQSLDSLKST